MSVRQIGALAAFAVAGLLVAMVFGAVSASAETAEFNPSAEQSFVVPAGVKQVEVVAVGGAGEDGGLACQPSPVPGGSGAKVTATLPVGEGETLKVRFGGGGARGLSGACPAGDGGGRSEVLSSSPLVVAGGGGGGGAPEPFQASGGEGGSAKALVGDNGHTGESGLPGDGGEGGSLSDGKGGGEAFASCYAGFAGVLENGGTGGYSRAGCEIFPSGGGGGGGYRGGGGGEGGITGGGGGAGSSFIALGATGEVVSGAGEEQRVLITYPVGAATVQERLASLLASVAGAGAHTHPPLTSKVMGIQHYLAEQKTRTACVRLAAFIRFVNARTPTKLTDEQAALFDKQADEIEAALGC